MFDEIMATLKVCGYIHRLNYIGIIFIAYFVACNSWLKDAVQKHLKNKSTPEFTIQGIMDDKNSDYYSECGSLTVTCVGCVLTGDLNLINLDSNGDVVDDVIAFTAKNIV